MPCPSIAISRSPARSAASISSVAIFTRASVRAGVASVEWACSRTPASVSGSPARRAAGARAGLAAGGRHAPARAREPLALVRAREVDRHREPHEQPRPQRAVLLAAHLERLLDELRQLVVDRPAV